MLDQPCIPGLEERSRPRTSVSESRAKTASTSASDWSKRIISEPVERGTVLRSTVRNSFSLFG